MAELIYYLGEALAPCISIHGVLVDVYGEGLFKIVKIPCQLQGGTVYFCGSYLAGINIHFRIQYL